MRLIAFTLVVAGCGGGLPSVGAPEGQPLLPDLTPVPPVDVRTTFKDGSTVLRFSSTLVNVGEGDFVLRATRQSTVLERLSAQWVVEQEVEYSINGGELIPTDAAMVWGGDGHDHWHIERVASYRLVPLDDNGDPVDDKSNMVDSKVGFCFFDHSLHNDSGPEEAVFSVHACGDLDDREIRMGMSPGWADMYPFTLPGQSINIDGLPDGNYRLWAEADAAQWFDEVSRDNNLTWVDLEISTRDDGLRRARLIGVGPEPS